MSSRYWVKKVKKNRTGFVKIINCKMNFNRTGAPGILIFKIDISRPKPEVNPTYLFHSIKPSVKLIQIVLSIIEKLEVYIKQFIYFKSRIFASK